MNRRFDDKPKSLADVLTWLDLTTVLAVGVLIGVALSEWVLL